MSSHFEEHRSEEGSEDYGGLGAAPERLDEGMSGGEPTTEEGVSRARAATPRKPERLDDTQEDRVERHEIHATFVVRHHAVAQRLIRHGALT